MKKEFRCKSKRLADYLAKCGSKLIRSERENGDVVFVFEHDDSIEGNIDHWETMSKRCMF